MRVLLRCDSAFQIRALAISSVWVSKTLFNRILLGFVSTANRQNLHKKKALNFFRANQNHFI